MLPPGQFLLQYKVSRDEDYANYYQKITKEINSLDLSTRIERFPLLPPDRADVFPAALLVILELLKFCELTSLTHSFQQNIWSRPFPDPGGLT